MVSSDKIIIELGRSTTSREKRRVSSLLDTFIQSAGKDTRLRGKVLRMVLDEEDAPKINIPCSIFLRELGILETVVKYLHEEESLSYKEISHALKRSKNNIVVSYINSRSKHPKPLRRTRSSIKIPIDIFTENHTCFESICLYLRDNLDLQFNKIGKLLDRSDKTIWTVYNQAKLKEKDA